MSVKHTNGPWVFMDDGKSVWGDDGAEVICSIYECDSSQDRSAFYGKITQANARLISAAPELLESLAELVARFGTRAKDRVDMAMIQHAEKIIAKATGESP